MSKVIVYGKDNCPYCSMAKQLLTSRHIPFEEVRVDLDGEQLEEMIRLSKRRTVPQIFIDSQPIGGYDDLAAMIQAGKLNHLSDNHEE